MLSESDVDQRIDALGEYVEAKEYLRATVYEVGIWREVLEAISDGTFDAQDLAGTALRTLRYKFNRSYVR